MHIYVNNKLAALKKGTSFEYVSENRLFSGSDGYTLTITFPLKGCPENIAIFGHINLRLRDKRQGLLQVRLHHHHRNFRN